MASNVTISNRALTLLGQQPISAPSENSPRGRTVQRVYDEVREDLLSRHPWNFAHARKSLAAATEAPEHGFARKFKLPVDCIRVLSADVEYEKYSIEDGYILTDASAPLAITYVANVTDVGKMPAYFRTAMAYLMASEMAYDVTANARVRAVMEEQANNRIKIAKSADAQEGEVYEQADGTWLESRF